MQGIRWRLPIVFEYYIIKNQKVLQRILSTQKVKKKYKNPIIYRMGRPELYIKIVKITVRVCAYLESRVNSGPMYTFS